MSVICLTLEDNDLTGLDCHETDMHCRAALRNF